MNEKVLIIPKLRLHNMYMKPKSVWLFMPSIEKFRRDENQKIGLNAGLLLRKAKKCQGCVFEIKCPLIAQIYATLTTATGYPRFRSNETSKIDFLTLFTTVFAQWAQYYDRMGARKTVSVSWYVKQYIYNTISVHQVLILLKKFMRVL